MNDFSLSLSDIAQCWSRAEYYTRQLWSEETHPMLKQAWSDTSRLFLDLRISTDKLNKCIKAFIQIFQEDDFQNYDTLGVPKFLDEFQSHLGKLAVDTDRFIELGKKIHQDMEYYMNSENQPHYFALLVQLSIFILYLDRVVHSLAHQMDVCHRGIKTFELIM